MKMWTATEMDIIAREASRLLAGEITQALMLCALIHIAIWYILIEFAC